MASPLPFKPLARAASRLSALHPTPAKKRRTMAKKRTPSTTSVASPKATDPFAPARNVPVQVVRPPKKLSFFKRSWIWYESSFAISMLEPWEKILLHTFALALFFLFYFAVSTYLPAQIKRIAGRVGYYVYGSESDVLAAE